MFYISLGIFIVFSSIWGFFASAALYHLKKYAMPGWTAPRLVVPLFFSLSLLFFLLSLYFLFTMPRTRGAEDQRPASFIYSNDLT
ncbi:MAG: hypothetical protein A3A28_00690 [Candidatus Sungbacteria bacterium RIFCSPLOWO2_01_FULL_47_32]|uniref:Uncharacterized protein n=1 Tax=Candidatus Sungbacteria bacterium RIFCSPHIGHO2_01_FULL_47_32 TaxID=1802264 RepID=A0A1G2K2V1_9BACT|nr:MAG: hypothetical protein A2633_02695 [Candidatus Sungbacteria bacterium RIFCSPHIGHO2_01_FULL_47_32]OHA00027.1 MAG: hypothetical protein A3D57_03825 [Candidatus Sungbacteria bacterium RIFCSPHIGHO2_02_FULL_46_12]OHA05125.1 MAG: hypothetical protein A3A28_00690 [Candidatus Sungbacteria bacterium RIFCSPLOWO2_01_FULL_47_32]